MFCRYICSVGIYMFCRYICSVGIYALCIGTSLAAD